MKLNFTKTDEKVTREMAVQNELLFLPQNSQQSAYIQKRLFEMGFIWANGSSSLQHDAECVSNGIVVKNQRIYYLGDEDDARGYKLCTMEQLSPQYQAPSAQKPLPARDELKEMFRAISTRLAAIERRLSDIEEKLGPNQKSEKPKLNPPSKGNRPGL